MEEVLKQMTLINQLASRGINNAASNDPEAVFDTITEIEIALGRAEAAVNKILLAKEHSKDG